MPEAKQLSQEEMQLLQSLTSDYNSIRNNLGLVELEINRLGGVKEQLFESNKQVLAKEKEIVAQLQQKYGVGTVDLTSGVFIVAEEQPTIKADQPEVTATEG